jgi:hypothetical protein
LVDFVGTHPQLSFLAVFLLALSEAVPVVGTLGSGGVRTCAKSFGVTPTFIECGKVPASAQGA